MFKNAEYRMSLARSLKGLPRLPAPAVVSQGNVSFAPGGDEATRMTGQVQVRTSGGDLDLVSVDVKALTGALSREVEDLDLDLVSDYYLVMKLKF